MDVCAGMIMMKGTAPWGEEVAGWQLQRHYLPNVVMLDRVISNLECLIWEREYLKHPSVSDLGRGEERTHFVSRVIQSPHYKDQLAQRRNTLLVVRNDLAAACGIKPRKAHDLDEDACGYITDYRDQYLPEMLMVKQQRNIIIPVCRATDILMADIAAGDAS